MEITVTQQTWSFLLSVALGGALGACYDVFRILRVAFKHSMVAVAVEDLLFSALSIAATFLFLLEVQQGELRMFLLLGQGIGFVLYYCTLGVLILGTAKSIIAVVRAVLRFLFSVFIAPFLKIGRFLSRRLRKIFESITAFSKKSLENVNRHLK